MTHGLLPAGGEENLGIISRSPWQPPSPTARSQQLGRTVQEPLAGLSHGRLSQRVPPMAQTKVLLHIGGCSWVWYSHDTCQNLGSSLG